MIKTLLANAGEQLIDTSKEYIFTWDMFGSFILGVCGLIIAIWGVLEIFYKVKNKINKPEQIQNDRILKLENQYTDLKNDISITRGEFRQSVDCAMAEYKSLIEHYWETKTNHDKAIQAMNDGLLIVIKSLNNITFHMRYGNHTDEMAESIREMEEYQQKRMKYDSVYPLNGDTYADFEKKMEKDT